MGIYEQMEEFENGRRLVVTFTKDDIKVKCNGASSNELLTVAVNLIVKVVNEVQDIDEKASIVSNTLSKILEETTKEL